MLCALEFSESICYIASMSDILTDTKCIDLFCGIGGLTHGLEKEHVRVVAGIDIDPDCRTGYEENNLARFVASDIAEVTPEDLSKLYVGARVRVLVGCAPCQPFSGLNRAGLSSDKVAPLRRFGELVSDLRPEIVSMENVRGLAQPGKYPVFREFLNLLHAHGYSVSCNIVDASDYGVPQKRVRLVLLASRLGEIRLIHPTHLEKVTVRDAIGHLPTLEAGGADPIDVLHRAVRMNELNRRRIEATPKDGGDSVSWPDELLPNCYRRASGRSYRYTVYGRMWWDKPAPTITTKCVGFGNGRFGHPEQNRSITLREAALLQTFPPEYQFVHRDRPVPVTAVARFIGNAVPVRLGQVIGNSIRTHIAERCC